METIYNYIDQPEHHFSRGPLVQKALWYKQTQFCLAPKYLNIFFINIFFPPFNSL